MRRMPPQTHSNLLADKSRDARRQDKIHEVPGMRKMELAEKSFDKRRIDSLPEDVKIRFVDELKGSICAYITLVRKSIVWR